jgi:hypothetical protein
MKKFHLGNATDLYDCGTATFGIVKGNIQSVLTPVIRDPGGGGITTILFTQYTVQNRKLPPSLSGSTLLNPVIVFVRKVLTCE